MTCSGARESRRNQEYTDDNGKVTEVLEWFGYKLHLLVDAKHEVSLSYEITDTKAGDGETLPTIYAQAKANLPAGRFETLRYDKAADTRRRACLAVRGRHQGGAPNP